MRKINSSEITNTVAQLCIQANIKLRPDVLRALRTALAKETNQQARRILEALVVNARCARKLNLAICQDTGLPYVFIELGQQVLISGTTLNRAINQGIEKGYRRGFLRSSIVAHPLRRDQKPGFSPGVLHVDIVRGRGINLTVLPKGFGSENKSAVKMFRPTAGIEALKQFVISTVREAGPDACPPVIVGVGIGGGMDQAALLAKKALIRPMASKNPDRLLARLERELLAGINQLGIGPMGLGGRTTALGISVLAYPTHIAGLPVAVNISCHALRTARKRL